MKEIIYDITSSSKLSSVACELLRLLDNRIFIFYGEVGAGKTTLIKHLCHHLNVMDPVSSPTFSIVNEYMTSENKKIFHFDLYRLNNIEEVIDMGVETYLNTDNYCFIEWPDLIESLLPKNYSILNIRFVGCKRKLIVL
tara:strand:- start:248 stop:664 length:417 start_codon:yes stop_codon:yes gene_type:complete